MQVLDTCLHVYDIILVINNLPKFSPCYFQEAETSPWVTNNMIGPNAVDDAGVLLDFATWKSSVYQYLPTHDHAGLFTG